MSVCLVRDCQKVVHSFELCGSHSHRLRRYGDPLGKPELPTLADRFYASIFVDTMGGCWLWTRCLNEHGYGMLSVGGRSGGMQIASRVSWTLHRGSIADDVEICHWCDTPPCVNPGHLFLGTHQENMMDMLMKKGHPMSSLTREDVYVIRDLWDSKDLTRREIAQLFQVNPQTIWEIGSRRTWRYLPEEV